MTRTMKKVAAAAASLCAAVAMVAGTGPAADAAFVTTCSGDTVPGVDVCIDDLQWVQTLVGVPSAGTNAVNLGNVVARVDVYGVPNTSVAIPCVVFVLNTTTTNPCATIGLEYRSTLTLLYDGPVDGATPTIGSPLVEVMVCTGTLNANVSGVGINDQPITTPCVASSLT